VGFQLCIGPIGWVDNVQRGVRGKASADRCLCDAVMRFGFDFSCPIVVLNRSESNPILWVWMVLLAAFGCCRGTVRSDCHNLTANASRY